jgi:hypothetical protein
MSCRFIILLSILTGIFFAGHSALEREESSPKRKRVCPPPAFETPEKSAQGDSVALGKAIEIGLRAKFLANVYLGDEDSKTNIFVPVLTLHFIASNGTPQEESDFVRSDKEKICLFASGGGDRGHLWEKELHRMYYLLFGERVKVIRASWLEKHLYTDRRLSNILGKTPKDLHSEIFWKIYVDNFLEKQLSTLAKGRPLDHMKVQAFSWWEVCDSCHEGLPYKYKGTPLSYHIVSCRPYKNHHGETPGFQCSFLQGVEEKRGKTLKDIFDRIMGLSQIYEDQSKEEKRTFWTTGPGGEAAKWLGHTFHRKNPLLKDYLQSIPESEIPPLEELLSYLRRKNWELSCYQKKLFAYRIQEAWESYWGQRVIPHFGWTFMGESFLESADGMCEMCGKKGIRDLSFVYHPKHRGAAPKAFKKEDQAEDLGSPAHKKGCLTVGSECVKYMQLSEEVVRRKRETLRKNRKKMDPLRQELAAQKR